MQILSKIIISALMLMFFDAACVAQTSNRTIIVEDLPQPDNFYRVSASKSHSGFAVPRFVSLKYGEVNGRLGPSRQHPVLWRYQRKGMPLIVVAEMDIWRKVRDIDGDESWMRKSSITSVNKVIAISEVKLRRRAKVTSAIIAIADKDALLELIECNDSGWCKVRGAEGQKGWVRQAYIWGSGSL